MKLSIYSIQSALFEGEVETLTLPTPMGEITVLPNHLPLISLVNPGEIRYTHFGSTKTVRVAGGVMEVRPGSEVVILAEEERI